MQEYGIAITLLACLCCASAMNCYICNSLVDQGCDGPVVKKEYLTNCSVGRNYGTGPSAFKPVPNAKVCWKQRQDVDGTIIVDRMCGEKLDTTNYYCYDRVGTKKIKVRYCPCGTSGCNGSATLAVSAPLVLLLLSCISFALL